MKAKTSTRTTTKNAPEKRERQTFKVFSLLLVGICVYLTYTNSLPRWLYLEHLFLLLHTWAPENVEWDY